MALHGPLVRRWDAPFGLQSRSHDLVPFAAPGNRDIYYPGGIGHHYRMPYGHVGHYLNHPGRNPYRAPDPTGVRGFTSLTDKTIETTGDLGWTLDYATAWLYKYLNNSRPDIADAIDHIRESFDSVRYNEAFLIFDMLDAAIFGGKLKGMVFLTWSPQASCSPGKTSAPNVVPTIPRICIQLNQLLFDDGIADVDELLEVMIHQMIHAYFLVCCGAQKRGDRADGRLEDGKHFAVLLMAIRGISKECEEGELELIFHASKRRQRDMGVPPGRAAMATALTASRGLDPHLAINPGGQHVGFGLVDNQTNCLRDNRHVTPADVQNWQMIDFGRALELDMEAKGEKVWDFAEDGKLVEMERNKCPPSATYIEMLWDDRGLVKRVMAVREKALTFKSLEKPLLKHERFELKVPVDTTFETFKCIWDYISKNGYCATPLEKYLHGPVKGGDGPPVLYREHTPGLPAPPDTSIVTHIRVFKAAEGMKFVELQRYALGHMWQVPWTHEDPIILLRELYNVDQDPEPGPINAELHKWARMFLAKRAAQHGPVAHHRTFLNRDHDIYHHHPPAPRYTGGLPNMTKIQAWYGEEFQDLYYRSQAFRDDYQQAQLLVVTGTGNILARRAAGGGAIARRQHLTRDAVVAPLAIANGPGLVGMLDDDTAMVEPALPLPDIGGLNLGGNLPGAGLGLRGGLDAGIINPLGGIGAGAGVPLGVIPRGPGLSPYMPI